MKSNLLAIILSGAAVILAGCQSSGHHAEAAVPLAGTHWTLVELNGQPYKAVNGLSTPTLWLDESGLRVTGMSGINEYSGAYQQDQGYLKFGVLMGTRMAGPKGATDYETAFLKALGAVSGWRISGWSLELLDGSKVVTRFSADAPTSGPSRTY